MTSEHTFKTWLRNTDLYNVYISLYSERRRIVEHPLPDEREYIITCLEHEGQTDHPIRVADFREITSGSDVTYHEMSDLRLHQLLDARVDMESFGFCRTHDDAVIKTIRSAIDCRDIHVLVEHLKERICSDIRNPLENLMSYSFYRNLWHELEAITWELTSEARQEEVYKQIVDQAFHNYPLVNIISSTG